MKITVVGVALIVVSTIVVILVLRALNNQHGGGPYA